jgi:hypothetical protein
MTLVRTRDLLGQAVNAHIGVAAWRPRRAAETHHDLAATWIRFLRLDTDAVVEADRADR